MKAHTLIDDFNLPQVDLSKWTPPASGTMAIVPTAISDRGISIQASATTQTAVIRSAEIDMQDSDVVWNVQKFGSTSTNTLDLCYVANAALTYLYGWRYYNGTMRIYVINNGTVLGLVTYSNWTYKYLRVSYNATTTKMDWWAGNNADGSDQIRVTPSLTTVQVNTPAATSTWNEVSNTIASAMHITLAQQATGATSNAFVINGVNAYKNSIDYSNGDPQVYLDDDFTRFPLTFAQTTLTNPTVGRQYGPYIIHESAANTLNVQKNTGWDTPILNVNSSTASSGIGSQRTNMLAPIKDIDFTVDAAITISGSYDSSVYTSLFWRSTTSTSTPTRYELRIFNGRMVLYAIVRGVETTLYTHWTRTENFAFYTYRIIHVGQNIAVLRNSGQPGSDIVELFRLADTSNYIQAAGHVGWRAKAAQLRLRRLNIAYGTNVSVTQTGQFTLTNAKKGIFIEDGLRYDTSRSNSSTDTSLVSTAESDLATSFESVYHYTGYSDTVDADVISSATTYAQARKKNFISWNAFNTTNLSAIATGGADTVIDDMIDAVGTIPGEVYVAPLPFPNLTMPWSPIQFDETGVAASGTDNRYSIVDSEKTWTTNELVGATVRTLVDGVSDWFVVESNTSDTLQLTKSTNLITGDDSNFEGGVGNWVGFGGGVLTSTSGWSYRGTNSLVITGGGARLAVADIEPGEHYTFSYGYQNTNRSDGRIVWKDSNGGVISYQYGPTLTSQSLWNTAGDRFNIIGGVAPEGAVTADLEIYHVTTSGSANADFVKFSKAARPDMPELGMAYRNLGGATYYIQRPGRGGTAQDYIAAFRYIRDRFRAAGSSAKITWALSSRASTYRSGAFMEAFFPGYDNLDHVLVHAVNPGFTNQTSWTDTVTALQNELFYQRLEMLLRGSLSGRSFYGNSAAINPSWGNADPIAGDAALGLGMVTLDSTGVKSSTVNSDSSVSNNSTTEYVGGIGFQTSAVVGWTINPVTTDVANGTMGSFYLLDNGTSTQKKITLVTGSAEPIHKFNDFESGQPGEVVSPGNTESTASDAMENISGNSIGSTPTFGGIVGSQIYKGTGSAVFSSSGLMEWQPAIGGSLTDAGVHRWGGKALSTNFYFSGAAGVIQFVDVDPLTTSNNEIFSMHIPSNAGLQSMRLTDVNGTTTASGAIVVTSSSSWYRAQVDMLIDPDRPQDMAISASVWDVTDGDGVRGAELQKITWPGTFSQLLAPNNANFTTSVTGYESVTNATLTWATTPAFSSLYTPNSLKAVNTAAGSFTFRLKTAAPNSVAVTGAATNQTPMLATASVAATAFSRTVRMKMIFIDSGGTEVARYISNPYIINAHEWTNIGVFGRPTTTAARVYVEFDYGVVGSATTTTGEGLYLDNVHICTSPLAPTASGAWSPLTPRYINYGSITTGNIDQLAMSSDGYSHNANKSEWANSLFSATSFSAIERVVNWFADYGQEFVPAETVNGIQYADGALSMDADTRYDSSKRTLQTYRDLFSTQKLSIYSKSMSIPAGWNPSAQVGQVEYMKLVERGYEDLVLSPRSGGLCLSSFNLGSPSMREATEVRPLSDGSRDFTEFLGSKGVSIEMMTYTNNQGQTSYFRDLLASWMRPNRRPTLVYKMRGHNEERYINLRPSDIGREWEIDNIRTGVAMTPMNFVAVDGKDFSTDTREYKLVHGTTPSSVLTYGTARTYPKVRLYSNSGGLGRSEMLLINQTLEAQKGLGSARISVKCFLQVGEFVEIDMENRTIQYMGLSGPGYSYLRHINQRSWFPLQPTVNDLIFLSQYDFGGTAYPATLDQAIITVRDAWL